MMGILYHVGTSSSLLHFTVEKKTIKTIDTTLALGK